MEGSSSEESRGMIPRSISEIFNYLSFQKIKSKLKVSYFQIYNESILDLLSPSEKSLQIREDKAKKTFIEGLSEFTVCSFEEVLSLLQKGSQMRVTGSTKMNDLSSRSHAIFVLTIEQNEKISKINFVDLAGSERVRSTGATGVRLEESKKINQSLSALGNVIAALTDSKGKSHIPYRDSKITRILEDSLGGNCRTVVLTMISAANENFSENVKILTFIIFYNVWEKIITSFFLNFVKI